MELILALSITFSTLSINVSEHLNTGKYCVGNNVKVGDLVQEKDGVILEVTEVEGTSVFCRNAELPIKVTVK